VPNIHPQSLEVGKSYKVTETIPLMPAHVSDFPCACESRIRLVEGLEFEVMERRNAGSTPWYRVRPEGWINSCALAGKTITEVKE